VPPRPRLLTFDVFGTLLDWRTGLAADVARAGGPVLDQALFDRVIDAQAELEQGAFRTYAKITATSLTRVLGLDPHAARRIGERVGEWPLYPDTAGALARLAKVAPCAATTNSDRAHRPQVEAQLGASLAHWICAEDVGAYKPDSRVWHAAGAHARVLPGPAWWHVSAYADYDLATARALGLTCVFVARPHARAGTPDLIDVRIPDLTALAEHVEQLAHDTPAR
jgi:2-haloalkanoic acid dehalogenase type II